MRRFEKNFTQSLHLDGSKSKFLAELIFIGTDVQSVSSLQKLQSEIRHHCDVTKVMEADKAQFVLSFAHSLAAIQEKHGLLAIYGPLPPNAKSYYMTELLAMGGQQQPLPASGSGLGYGVLFDARHSRAVVQFGDKMRVLLESDIFIHYSIFKIGIPNAPMEARDCYWQISRTATP
jgi:hypothetical protein